MVHTPNVSSILSNDIMKQILFCTIALKLFRKIVPHLFGFIVLHSATSKNRSLLLFKLGEGVCN